MYVCVCCEHRACPAQVTETGEHIWGREQCKRGIPSSIGVMFRFCMQFLASISRNNGRGKQKDGPKRRSIDRKAGLTSHSSWLRTCWSFHSPEAAAQSTLVRPRPVTYREERRSRRRTTTGRSQEYLGVHNARLLVSLLPPPLGCVAHASNIQVPGGKRAPVESR